MLKYALLGATAVMLGLLLTPVVRWLALRLGAVDEPGGRRIHGGRIPRLGGLAVFAAFVTTMAIGYAFDRLFHDVFLGYGWAEGCVFAGAVVVVTAGVVDDIWSLGPLPKLGFQILAGAMALAGSCGIETITNPFTGGLIQLGWLAVPATLLWVVGITNAFNLIDGLDGLAAGVSLIAAATLFVVSTAAGRIEVAVLSVVLAGTLAGFLCYNFNPASIFLGDSGSLLLGFLLSVLSIESAQKGATAIVILVPILALGLPIMDTLLAMLRRLLRALRVVRTDPERNEYHFFVIGSASVFRADRDHIHHRLLALGLTQRRAVLLLYGVCVALGVLAFLAVTARGVHATMLVALVGLATYVGIRKLGYREVEILRRGTLLPLFELPVVSRRAFHALIDSLFIAAAYWGSFLVVEGAVLEPSTRSYFLRSVLIVVAVKLIVFASSDLYERTYRHSDARDLIGVMKGLAAAQLATGLMLAVVYGVPLHFTAIVLLDFYLTATLVVGARVSFRVLEALARAPAARQARPVLIYGVGSHGIAVLHELLQNPSLGYRPVGFVDDLPALWNRQVNGVPVVGGPEHLPELLRRQPVHEVILANATLTDRQTAPVARACLAAGVQLSRFRFALERINPLAPGGKDRLAAAGESRIREAGGAEPSHPSGRTWSEVFTAFGFPSIPRTGTRR